MLTSSAEDRDIIESYQLGVNSYIVKPVDFEQFSETARQLGYYWLLINKQPTEVSYFVVGFYLPQGSRIWTSPSPS